MLVVYQFVGNIMNYGQGPALNTSLHLTTPDGVEAKFKIDGKDPIAIPPLGVRDYVTTDSTYWVLTNIEHSRPDKGSWVLSIRYDDLFGRSFSTLYDASVRTIRFRSPARNQSPGN